MRPTDVKFLARACDGSLLGKDDAMVFDVKIDSRQAFSGDMFVAVVGDKNDGHSYKDGAYEAGCRIFLMSDRWQAAELTENRPDATVILVEDTVDSFSAMAKAYIDQFNPLKIGVTGSVGKTTTRTMTAAVLSGRYNTVSSQKNYNTKLGLCLTCFLADDSTEAVVFEMGMDRANEIAEYCSWISLDAAVITNVGISHLERLGTREAIANAKLEICQGLKPGAALVYNADSDYLDEQYIRSHAQAPSVMYAVGRGRDARIRLFDVDASSPEGIRFSVADEADIETVTLSLPGEHNAINGALAMAVGLSLGMSLPEAAKALSAVKGNERRLSIEELSGFSLIDDTYNASPDSMKAAIGVLASMKAKRTVAIFTQMLELGSMEEEGHESVGRCLMENHINLLVAIGPNGAYYTKGACGGVSSVSCVYYEDVPQAIAALPKLIEQGDAVLVKGSNATGISALAAYLREAGSE